MSKSVQARLAALAVAVVGAFAAIVALALPSGAAGSLTATCTLVQEWPGSYFQGQYTLTNGTSSAAAGVVAILFGAGTGTGTEGVPEVPGISQTAPTDYGYWIARVQRYLASPVPLS